MTPVQCFIGLGSNQNRPLQQLKTALSHLADHPQITLERVSRFYSTEPLGGLDQPNYVNAVAQISTLLVPESLLDALQEIENLQGRMRGEVRWQARTLDLDMILYGNQVINTARLTVPHYAMHERNFVVFPLLEIAPECEVPERGSLRDISTKLSKSGMALLSV